MSAYAAHAALPSFADTQTLAEIRTHLGQLVTEAQTRAASYSAYTANLWEQISVSIDGGKLTRPALVVLGYQAFGGVASKALLDLACAFELLHTALLMHDDVVDRDYVRRGAPTLSAHYRDLALAAGRNSVDADHAGNSAAIIAGDLLLAEAIKIAGRSAQGLDCEAEVEAAFTVLSPKPVPVNSKTCFTRSRSSRPPPAKCCAWKN